MSTMFRNAAMASSIALMAFAGAGMATAQDSNKNYTTLNDCGNQQNCGDQRPGNSGKQRTQNNQGYGQNEDQPGDMQIRKKLRQNSQGYNGGDQPDTMRMHKKRSAQNNNNRNWKYDSNRHDRRRSKNSQFRFYFGGFYYAQPYWAGESYGVRSYRVGCGEGRSIVDNNGYNRVRTIECGGGTFTYLGRRNGDTFRVFLNSRTGRIVGRQAV